ncbi:hypothetical protein DQK91_02810 [Oceanidesulfovibrio marinus]|uniref:Portal protein n=2 Tax=Oceanidesulfovibrio marinus TaxID=370038 RepID=A0A6P1ZJ26_9BACT|nr:hypothetical protein DQK91_02810 [Oceanidesulfovibrio marinus]
MDTPLSPLANELLREFDEAEKAKKPVEDRFIKSLRQYKGQYDPEIHWNEDKDGNVLGSQIYVRHTKAKCDTLTARLMDLLFPTNGERNWGIAPSPKPSVSPLALEEYKRDHADDEEVKAVVQKGDQDTLIKMVADDAAERMSKVIEDQLTDTGGRPTYQKCSRKVIHDGVVLSTGVLKGPLVERRREDRFVYSQDERGVAKWEMITEEGQPTPYFEQVSPFNVYPDPGALDPSQLLYVWQDHVMTRRDFLDLRHIPGFMEERLRQHITDFPDGDAERRDYETEVRSLGDDTSTSEMKGRYRVLERWGQLTGQQLLDAGLDRDDIEESDTYDAVIWMTKDGTVLKAAPVPVDGVGIPFYFFQPYEDESSFWSESLPEIIRDPQEAINAAARATLDNAAICTGPQIGVNMSALQAGEDPTNVHPFKVWMFESVEDMKSAFQVYTLPSYTKEHMAIMEKFSQVSDEVSVPRFMRGDNAGVDGAGDTASGLSMLMSSATLPIKDTVAKFDSGVTEPFIRALYRWNMRFHDDERIKGDYSVIARGSTSLLAQELMGRRLMEAMSVLFSPALAEQTDREKVYEYVVRALNLPDDIQMDQEEVERQRMQVFMQQKRAELQAVMEELEKKGIPPEQALMQMAQSSMAVLQQANAQGGGPGAMQQPPPMQQGMGPGVAAGAGA